MNRRRLLATTTLVPLTAVGGCLGDSKPADSGNENGDDTPPDKNGTEFEYEVKQIGFLRATNNPIENDSVGHVDVFESTEETYDTLPLDDLFDGDRQPSTEEFIEDTDFDTGFLLYVVTRWPKTNSTEIEIQELDREDDTITGTAATVGAEEGDDAPSYPLALVRMFVGDDRPSSVEMTVIDGRENEDTLEVDVP